MVLLSSMQLDYMARQEAVLRQVQVERMAHAAGVEAFKAAGSPKPQSQFFRQRFGSLITRLKLQTA